MYSALKKHWLRYAVHVACLIPFALLLWDWQTDNLTVNPIQAATFRTGKIALIILVLSLVVTPLKRLTNWKIMPLRRPLGLYAFFYVCLHLTIFVALDYGFDWAIIWQTISEKRYVLVGFTAWLLLVPLAITSTKGWMRRLGKRWKALHKLVYLAAILAVVHYFWLVKEDTRQPLLFGAAVALLLLMRVQWKIRNQKSEVRKQRCKIRSQKSKIKNQK